jgi:hypothetical protein
MVRHQSYKHVVLKAGAIPDTGWNEARIDQVGFRSPQ